MQCRDFKEIVDSYLKDELLIETNHDVIKHTEACPACRRELAARRETRAQLRRALAAAPEFQMRPEFAFQLRNKLKAQALGKHSISRNPFAFLMRPQWFAITACLAVVACIVGIFALRPQGGNPNELAGTRQTTNVEARTGSPANDLTGAAVRLASFDKTEAAAVGDHQNCAIKYNLAEEPIDLNEAGRKYDAAYIDLARSVQSAEGLRTGDIKYVEDHSCIYAGQRFAHIILEYKGRTISLLVAEVENTQLGSADGNAIACSQREGFQVSCFGTKRHTVFVISDLPEADNLRLARSLAPSFTKHIARAEA